MRQVDELADGFAISQVLELALGADASDSNAPISPSPARLLRHAVASD